MKINTSLIVNVEISINYDEMVITKLFILMLSIHRVLIKPSYQQASYQQTTLKPKRIK
jgi:hypothetical protein